MKMKLILAVMAIALVCSSCSDKNDDVSGVRVSVDYVVAVGGTLFTSVGSEAPALTSLKDFVAQEVAVINSTKGKPKWTVVGKGQTEKEAIADAEKQARVIYNNLEGALTVAIMDLKIRFEAQRKAKSAEIMVEPGRYYLRYSYMSELYRSVDLATVQQGTEVLFEARGGEDYSK